MKLPIHLHGWWGIVNQDLTGVWTLDVLCFELDVPFLIDSRKLISKIQWESWQVVSRISFSHQFSTRQNNKQTGCTPTNKERRRTPARLYRTSSKTSDPRSLTRIISLHLLASCLPLLIRLTDSSQPPLTSEETYLENNMSYAYLFKYIIIGDTGEFFYLQMCCVRFSQDVGGANFGMCSTAIFGRWIVLSCTLKCWAN